MSNAVGFTYCFVAYDVEIRGGHIRSTGASLAPDDLTISEAASTRIAGGGKDA